MSSETYEGWISIFESGTDYEADLVRDRLGDAGIPAVVLTQRDHAFNLTLGALAKVHVLVPPEHTQAAADLLATAPLSDADLEEAALAEGSTPDDYDVSTESLLDSGIEKIHLSPPDEGSMDES
ncbi:MAG: putative signal transducing protein [Rhodothermales bacterium]